LAALAALLAPTPESTNGERQPNWPAALARAFSDHFLINRYLVMTFLYKK
jgi:hypothetical protein